MKWALLTIFIVLVLTGAGLYLKRQNLKLPSGQNPSPNVSQNQKEDCQQASLPASYSWVYINAEQVRTGLSGARIDLGVYDSQKKYTGAVFKVSGHKFADQNVPSEAAIRSASETYSTTEIPGSQYHTFGGPKAVVIIPHETSGPVDIYAQAEDSILTDISIAVGGDNGGEKVVLTKTNIMLSADDSAVKLKLDLEKGLLCQ